MNGYQILLGRWSVDSDLVYKRYAQSSYVPLNMPFLGQGVALDHIVWWFHFLNCASQLFQVQQPSGDEAKDEGKDEAAPNRFSAVIEKIERLYMVLLFVYS